MSTVTAPQRQWSVDTQVLVETAWKLGRHHAAGEQESFLELLVDVLGVSAEDAPLYWAAIPLSEKPKENVMTRVQEVENNTELTELFGISLDPNRFPRNLLLYVVLAGLYPDCFQVKHEVHKRRSGRRGNYSYRPQSLVSFLRQPRVKHKRNKAARVSVRHIYQGQWPENE